MTAQIYDDINFDQADAPRKQGELHPRGSVKAVCVDVIDLGEVENTFKKNEDGSKIMDRRVRIVWQTAKKKADGKRFHISRSVKLSLYDGSNGGNAAALHTILDSWLGRDYDGKHFQAKQIVGRPAELFIEHEKGRKDKTQTYAKVLAVHPLDGEDFEADGSYKRFDPNRKPLKEESEEEVGF